MFIFGSCRKKLENMMKRMLNLKDEDFKDLESLKRAIKRQLKKRKIKIREEISEDVLEEIFYKTKENIKQKTKYEVDKFDFPKKFLFAWLFLGKDYRKFRKLVFSSMSKDERRKTKEVWKEEYSLSEPFSRTRVKNFSISFNDSFFVIALSSRRRDSLKHEITHYFELVLKLSFNSFQHIDP